MRTSFTFPVLQIGHRARDFLKGGTTGRVAAVFARSFYVESKHGMWACFGPPTIGMGPLNCVCDLSDRVDFRANGLHESLTFRVNQNLLRVAEWLEFSLEGAETWQPAKLSGKVAPHRLMKNLDRLVSAARTRLPATGLGFLIGGEDVQPNGNPLVVQAQKAVLQLVEWLEVALNDGTAWLAPPPAEAVRLIGLGPGLTPSGDDFVGGIMVALRFVGRCDIAEALARWALPLAQARSNSISTAYLAAAAAGDTGQGLHDVLVRLGSPDAGDLSTNFDAIDNIGHASGWDTLAGLVVACSLFARCHTSSLNSVNAQQQTLTLVWRRRLASLKQ